MKLAIDLLKNSAVIMWMVSTYGFVRLALAATAVVSFPHADNAVTTIFLTIISGLLTWALAYNYKRLNRE